MNRKNVPETPDKSSLRKKILIPIHLIIIVALAVALVYFAVENRKLKKDFRQTKSDNAGDCPSSLRLIRESSTHLTKTLLLADVETESSKYSSLKGEIISLVNSFQQKGAIQNVSVYLRDMSDASWMSIGGDQLYMPGSLMKVPIMIYFLKQEEDHPGTLKKLLYFEKPNHHFPTQEYPGDSILPGRNYSIAELLRYMIVESDNNATNVLSKNLQADDFRKIFLDLNIPPDEINDVNYVITSKDYSKFFRILYNTSYLGDNMSEYALELLSKSRFGEGITRKLPSTVTVARKFGERGIDNTMDFSESAIIYKGKTPYLLTVMTKGTQVKEQSELVSEISEEVFRSFPEGKN
jgi:beta-lactamase class A